jgi:hypothetical protein
MKIETTFAPPVKQWARAATVASWATAVVVGLTALALWFNATIARTEARSLDDRIEQLEARRAEQKLPPALPSQAQLQTLQARVAAVNALSVTQGRRLLPLLVLLEELLPADTWLTSVHQSARTGEVVLVAEAEQAEGLTKLLLSLEKSKNFTEVLLVRQMPVGTEGRRHIQFEVRLKERS